MERLIDLATDKWKEGSVFTFREFRYSYCISNPIKNIEELQGLYSDTLKIRVEGVPEYKSSESFEQSTELVAMNSKENLIAMKDSIEVLMNKRNQLTLMLNYQLCEVKEKFELMRRELSTHFFVIIMTIIILNILLRGFIQ